MARFFPGLWQKIAPVFILLTAIGWLLVVIGFGIGSEEVEDVKNGEKIPDIVFVHQGAPNDRSDPDSYLYWIVCISGVVVLPLALLHAALWPPYAAYIGAVVAFLNVWFVSGLGMILYYNGRLIRANRDNDLGPDTPDWFALEFAGSFLALLFWTPVVVLWSLYGLEVTVRLK